MQETCHWAFGPRVPPHHMGTRLFDVCIYPEITMGHMRPKMPTKVSGDPFELAKVT